MISSQPKNKEREEARPSRIFQILLLATQKEGKYVTACAAMELQQLAVSHKSLLPKV